MQPSIKNLFLPRGCSRNTDVPHQFSLDGKDSVSGCLTVALPASDDNHLRVAVLRWQVNLSVGLLSNLARVQNPFHFAFSFKKMISVFHNLSVSVPPF